MPERLMKIYLEMKGLMGSEKGKNDWVYVAEKLGIPKYTKENCRAKVKRLLRSKDGLEYVQRAINSPLASSGTFQTPSATDVTCK